MAAGKDAERVIGYAIAFDEGGRTRCCVFRPDEAFCAALQEALPEAFGVDDRMEREQTTLWARALAEIGTGALPPLWENLGEIDVETVLVCGAEDEKFSAVADAMRARLPRSRVVRVPACGHAPHLEAAG